MKRSVLILSISTLALSACSGMPDLIMWHDDDKPAYARNSGGGAGAPASREPLDVPPELRAEMQLPMEEQVATRADEAVLPKDYQDAVAGKAISLDARVYKQSAASLFSAVVDAMTSMNVPVQSVDSPSGIVTSDWIREGANNSALGVVGGVFGLGDEATHVRHRYIVRVYRTTEANQNMAKLEIRVHGQAYINRHWVNKPFKRKVTDQLFSAVEEQLARRQQPAKP